MEFLREAQEEQALKDLADMGVTIISPTEEELTDLFDRIRTNVWPQLADFVGADLLTEAAAQLPNLDNAEVVIEGQYTAADGSEQSLSLIHI